MLVLLFSDGVLLIGRRFKRGYLANKKTTYLSSAVKIEILFLTRFTIIPVQTRPKKALWICI